MNRSQLYRSLRVLPLLVLLLLALLIIFPHDEQDPAGDNPDNLHADSVAQVLPPEPVDTVRFNQVTAGESYDLLFADLDPSVRRQLVQLFSGIIPPGRLRIGTKYALRPDTALVPDSVIIQNEGSHYLVAVRDSAGYHLHSRRLAERQHPVLFSGEIESSLWLGMQQAQLPPELIMQFTDIFQWDVDFLVDTRRGDRFELLANRLERRDINGVWQDAGFGAISKASYVQIDNTSHDAYRTDKDELPVGYFTGVGEPLARSFLKSPLNYRRISSRFSRGRMHPVLKIVRPHNGVDFAAAKGTPVVASGDGTVVALNFEKRGMGRYVKIRHTNSRYHTLYGHLSAYAHGLKVGQKVKQNQVIGYVGSTGMSTGNHLHYTFLVDGKAVDPLRIPNPGLPPLTGDSLKCFLTHVRELDSLQQALKAEALIRDMIAAPDVSEKSVALQASKE